MGEERGMVGEGGRQKGWSQTSGTISAAVAFPAFRSWRWCRGARPRDCVRVALALLFELWAALVLLSSGALAQFGCLGVVEFGCLDAVRVPWRC